MKELVEFPAFVPKGKIKIELFDAETGGKVKEIDSENFISKGARDILFRMAIASLFTKNKAAGGLDLASYIADPFKTISLTAANHPEEPDSEWAIQGKLIGWAYSNTTSGGGDALRGLYNHLESQTNLEKVRLVFDFPAAMGNGTFQSIYFSTDNLSNTQPISNTTYFKKLTPPVSSAKIVKYGDKIYSMDSTSTGQEIYVYDAVTLQRLSIIKVTNFYIGDFEIVDGNIYYSTEYAPFVRKASLENPTVYTTVVATMPVFNPVQMLGGICYDTKKEQFIISSSNKSYGEATAIDMLHFYDKSFNLVSSKEIDTKLGARALKLVYQPEGIIIEGKIVNPETGISSFTGAAMHVRGVIDNSLMNQAGIFYPKYGISSRSLLDAPVTKTNAQVMKITYDFIFPPIMGV